VQGPTQDPVSQSREDYAELMNHISLADSPVGIDAKYTHAIIITYLQQIAARLETIETRLGALEK
jgi:hypothetical protein